MRKSFLACHFILGSLLAVSLILSLILIATHQGYRCKYSVDGGNNWDKCPKEIQQACYVPAADIHYTSFNEQLTFPGTGQSIDQMKLRCPFRQSTVSLSYIAMTVSTILLAVTTTALLMDSVETAFGQCLTICLGLGSLIFTLISFILIWIDVGKDDYTGFDNTGIWSRDRGGFKAAGAFFTLSFVLLVGLIINDILALRDKVLLSRGIPARASIPASQRSITQSRAPVITVDPSRQMQPTLEEQKKAFGPGPQGVAGQPIIPAATLNNSAHSVTAGAPQTAQVINAIQPGSATLNRSLNQAVASPRVPVESAQVGTIPQTSYPVTVQT